ncbi:MAG: hypothetical protein ABI134_16830 [Byssovorax sp.]
MPSQILANVTVNWKTPYSDEVWENLEGIATLDEEEFFALGPTLPKEEERERRRAVVGVHRHEDSDELHWVLNVQAAPSDEPPGHIKERDEKLGGRSGLASLLAQALPSSVPAVGAFRVRLFFPEAEFTCSMIPAVVEAGGSHDAVLLLGRGARLEQIGYRFEGGGAGGIEEVVLIYEHLGGRYRANISATGSLKLNSPTWLPFADDVAELVSHTFFASKETKP